MSSILSAVAAVMIGSSVLAAGPAPGVKGEYLEAHTTNLWASAVPSDSGEAATHQAVLAWKVAKGDYCDAHLDGLAVVAVVFADRPLLDPQARPRVHFLVDKRADTAQQTALVQMAKAVAPKALGAKVASVTTAEIKLSICCGCAAGYAELTAGPIRVKTRRISDADTLRFGQVKPAYSLLGEPFYKYSALTEEYAYSGGGNETCLPFVLTDLSSAAVGGFSR